MPVIEAQCASILVPHDHRRIKQMRMFAHMVAMTKHAGETVGAWVIPVGSWFSGWAA